jgi:acetyl-CoA C-acetyltransferase
MTDALIIDGVRTPRGRGKSSGSLHPFHPQELLAQVLNALLSRTEFNPYDVDDVVIGNASNDGDHGSNIARLGVLTAGWPIEVPGMTINRYCGSGAQAVAIGAMGIASGMQQLVVAGGVESMSRFLHNSGTTPLDGGNASLRTKHPVVPQGISADLIATLEQFTRADVDEYAVRSQDRAAKAAAEGRFQGSVIPVHHPDGSRALDTDEHPRPGTTMDNLAKLAPAFESLGRDAQPGYDRPFNEMALERYPQLARIEHVHHAGNSSGVTDGAGALLLASPQYARAHGLKPRAKIVTHAVAGTDPVIMLTAPGPASQRCLAQAGMSVDDIDLWEVNEAFSSVVLKLIRDLGLDPDIVNANGGAIALGHPVGATGPMLVQTALDELERTDGSTALVTFCTGAGMATATLIERV